MQLQDDVGWNPIRLIFHERSESCEEHEEHEGENEANHAGNTRESLKPTRNSHTYARFSKHKERYKIHDQQGTIQR